MTKTYHCYDQHSGLYLGSLPASEREGVLPPDFTTFIEPPKHDGFFPVWDFTKNSWHLEEDHRGQCAWAKDLSGFLCVETLGVIPDGYTLQPPPEPGSGFSLQYDHQADTWALVEDHRGESGYVNGEYVTIDGLGPLPEGWTLEPPILPDTRTPEQKREDDYRIEVDPIANAAMRARTEAEALRLVGDTEGAAAADAHADDLLRQFLAKKEEIRQRYPDEGQG